VAHSGLWVTAPQENESLPIVSSITASFPGMKFEGERVERPGQGIEGFNLVVRRADQVIVVSILIMVLMMTLAMSVFLMSIEALTSSQRLDLLPLSLSVTLLLCLPALRNSQPAVPPLGAFGDYLSFLWAEQIVAVSAGRHDLDLVGARTSRQPLTQLRDPQVPVSRLTGHVELGPALVRLSWQR